MIYKSQVWIKLLGRAANKLCPDREMVQREDSLIAEVLRHKAAVEIGERDQFNINIISPLSTVLVAVTKGLKLFPIILFETCVKK